MDAVAVIAARHFSIDFGFWQEHPGVLSRAKPSVGTRQNLGMTACERVSTIQAIHESHSASAIAQKRCKREKSQGFCPEVIGGKIRDPGVDEQDERGF
jgi:hypothetical protein